MIGHSEYELKRKWEGWWGGAVTSLGCSPGAGPRGACRALSGPRPQPDPSFLLFDLNRDAPSFFAPLHGQGWRARGLLPRICVGAGTA